MNNKSPQKGIFDLIIIGGGASGLMASIQAAERGLRVLMLEKGHKLGRKLLISGGGRCNITNNKYNSIREFLSNYPRGNKFLWSILSRFNAKDTMNWFEQRGLNLKTEKDGRVFPLSDNSQSVLDILSNSSLKAGVQILLNNSVQNIVLENNLFEIYLDTQKYYMSQNLLITCGGMSYQKTGSSGDAYRWAKEFRHSIVLPRPSLTGYTSKDIWVHNLKGVSIQEVQLKLLKNNKSIATEKGAIVFTHWGLSGPCVFKITSLCAREAYLEKDEFILQINLFPQYSREELKNILKNKWKIINKKKVINSLEGLIPNKLEEYIISQMTWNKEKTNSEISNFELEKLLNYLMNLEINISGLRPSGEEIVTAGGIDLKEIDPKTMQSKIIPKLYWAGEILDIDGFTGGFNLQSAWSTGWLAGQSIE